MPAPGAGPLRYVILEHDHPFRHWDLMLEDGEILRTWRLLAPPAPGATVVAEASFDHRRVYLEYEGPLSGNRGTVVRWESGTFAWLERTDCRIIVRLDGQRLRGTGVLEPGSAKAWSFRLDPPCEQRS